MNRASRIQSSRIGSALVCVRRNVQHRELKLPKSTQFALNTVRMVAVSTCGPTGVCVCVCVCVVIPCILDVRLVDVPAGVTQEEGHTGFLIHLPSAVLAFIFLARRIQSLLSLVDREVEFCVLIN